MSPDTSPSSNFSFIVNRAKLYGAFAAIGSLNLSDGFLVFSLFMAGIPALIGLLAWNALIYFPLFDWPLSAWRGTRKRRVVVFWLCLALVVPAGVPLSVGVWKIAEAKNTIREMGLERTDLNGRPFVPHDLLITGGSDSQTEARCEEICQSLLWSGALQRVFVGLDFPEQGRDVKVTLFRVLHGPSCASAWGRSSRNGFCILGQKVENPPYDAIIRLSHRYYDPNLLVFDRLTNISTFEQQVRIYDCRGVCKLLRTQPTATGERFAFPLTVGLEMNIDSGPGWIGPYLLMREFVLNSPLDTIRSTLMLNAAGFSPRPME